MMVVIGAPGVNGATVCLTDACSSCALDWLSMCVPTHANRVHAVRLWNLREVLASCLGVRSRYRVEMAGM